MQAAQPTAPLTPGKERYDAIVVGSGAAGGMAAFQLAMAGVKVLLLEAGRMLDPQKEYKTMEWPYKDMRRHRLPVGEFALSAAEYRTLDRPYGLTPEMQKYKKVMAYSGNHFTKDWIADEKENPITGTPYAWVRARVLGGKTNLWGRVSLRFSELDLKAKSHDGFGEDWPIGYADISPYYDKVDTLLGISGSRENIPHLPDGIFQRPLKLNCGEVQVQRAIAKMGRRLIPGRAGVTTDGVLNNKYRARCMGRGRCGRGCDLNAAFHSPAALIFPARDSGNLTVRPDSVVSEVLIDDRTNKATGVRVIDKVTKETMEFSGRLVILAASCLESTRLLLNSRSASRPNGAANSSGVVGHYFCEHVMGPGASGTLPSRKGTLPTNDDGRPQSSYIVRFRNVTDRHPDFIRGYGFQGASGAAEYPANAAETPGFGASFKQAVREGYPARVNYGGFGEVLARKENRVFLDPDVKDAWGIPALRFDYTFGDNEKKMAADMADTAEEMLRAAGATDIVVRRNVLTEGWSIHEMGTARMGDDPKTSVTNSFGQTHDIRNLFVVDGSIFVSASCQNPTWMIMALCWRAMDYVKDEMKRGNL
ncbi:GMC family oxidoreductase [Luteitalea sp.]|uniref:GMC oxidoreductase n=1 Tax=Luteitalea sp. TaxID=2004800 RepID=UPI000AA1C231|nr:GMC family oxidoreductase [Luteitalea sp.]